MIRKSASMNSDYDYIAKHIKIWKQKTVLRRLYGDQYYSRLLKHLTTGSTNIEIGSGPGMMAEFAPNILRTDILTHASIQLTMDAHQMPFENSSIDNILGLDVLHHFNQPISVLQEVSRVLKPTGRFILVEPFLTPLSRLVYTYLHQEDCDLSVRPWEANPHFDSDKKAFDGNAAIPYLLLEKAGKILEEELPQLKLIKLQKFGFMTYLLSGGFKSFSLLPNVLYPVLQSLEDFSEPLWRELASLRALIVWEKRG